MGQLDSIVGQSTGDQPKLNLGGIQFHDVQGVQPVVSSGGGSNIDFNAIINGGSRSQTAPTARMRSSEQPLPQPRSMQTAPPAPERVQTNPPAYQAPGPGALVPDSSTDASTDASSPSPPHPDQSDSTGAQLGSLLSTGAILGATVIAGRRFYGATRNVEIANMQHLKDVVQPETLQTMRSQTAEVIKLVAAKSRAAEAEVQSIAMSKPLAFEEVREMMPPKPEKLGKQSAPEHLIYKQVKDQEALTEEELTVTDRAQYLRSVERVLVKDFNMPNNTRVDAFRSRQPNIVGLSESEAANVEGLADPLKKLEATSSRLLEETTTGRLTLSEAANSQIVKGMGVLAAGFIGSRTIDHMIYGKQSQGFLTTAYDCAAPFLVFTKMSPLAKIGLMIGAHELVRGVEYFTAKDKDQK